MKPEHNSQGIPSITQRLLSYCINLCW